MCKSIFFALLLGLSSLSSSAQDSDTSPVLYQITAEQLLTLKAELFSLKQERTTLRENLLSLKVLSATHETKLSDLQRTLDEATQRQDALQQLSDNLAETLKQQIEISSSLESKLSKAGESLTQALSDSRKLTEALKLLNQSLEKLKRQVVEEKVLVGVVAGTGGVAVGLIIGLLVGK